MTIAALIPTRNRAPLAINAVHSLLDQDCPIEIYVSDNSGSGDELRDFCRTEQRVQYLRPPREMSMPEHWDWAAREVLARTTATHLTLHYDRKFSKPCHWGALSALASQWPDDLITFAVDFIVAYPPPLRLWQPPWTGKAFRVQTKRVMELLASARVADVAHALPVLSNCLVPRTVLESIIDRFGDLCHSTGPDTAFLWRFLALHDQSVHYDCAMGVLYASHRSNGLGYMRGEGGDFPDYVKTWGDRPWLDAAPVPGLNLGYNMLYHEYEIVRRETGDRLPPLNRPAILNGLANELRWVDDPQIKAELGGILRQHGWNGSKPDPQDHRVSWLSLARQRVHLLKSKWFGISANTTGYSFPNDEVALRYALKYPRARQRELDHVAVLNPQEIRAE